MSYAHSELRSQLIDVSPSVNLNNFAIEDLFYASLQKIPFFSIYIKSVQTTFLMKQAIDTKENIFVGKIKKFCPLLYEKYDTPARNKIKEKLSIYVQDNPDIYEEDMILNVPECKYKYLELQVCTKWVGDKYPYDKPFVYARKKLFSENTLFLILDKHMTCGLLFDKKSLLSKPRRIKKYSRTFVYEAPWHRVMNVNLDDLDCDTINMYQ